MVLGMTIQIYLPDGNPRGVKIAEFTSRMVQAVLVPRAQVEFACSRPELGHVGVYFLFGEAGAGSLAQLYVGEAEVSAARLKQHHREKEWWTAALVCVTKTGGFTKAHVKYLEWFCHQEALAAGRFQVDNSCVPTKPHIPEPMEADLRDHFETIRILAATLGYPLFEKITQPARERLLTCQGKQARATGEYTEDGLVVFAGSTCNREEVKSIHAYGSVIRQQLQTAGILAPDGPKTLRFTQDHIFPSPSQAAMVVLARTANGWVEWKYPDGRTLDEGERS
jgi:hypothetical protein